MLTKQDLLQIKTLLKDAFDENNKKLDEKFITKQEFKTELKKELSNYPRKQDLKSEFKNFVTNKTFTTSVKEIIDYVNASCEGVKIDLRAEMKEMRDEMRNGFASIIKEIHYMKADIHTIKGDIEELKVYKYRTEDLERRMDSVESRKEN